MIFDLDLHRLVDLLIRWSPPTTAFCHLDKEMLWNLLDEKQNKSLAHYNIVFTEKPETMVYVQKIYNTSYVPTRSLQCNPSSHNKHQRKLKSAHTKPEIPRPIE